MTVGVTPAWRVAYDRAAAACAENQFVMAEKDLRDALVAAYSTNAPEGDVGQILFSLGRCLHAQEKLTDAKEAYHQALGMFERSGGAECVQVGDVLHNLGAVLIDMHDTG